MLVVSGLARIAGPKLLTDFQQPFDAELEVVCDLQARVLASEPGLPLLSALGALALALASLQRPARFFSDFHPDPSQAAAAAALLEVCRIASAEVYTHPRVVAALLQTAAALQPSRAERGRLVDLVNGRVAAASTRESGGRTGGVSREVAALMAASEVLQDTIYGLAPGDDARCGGDGEVPGGAAATNDRGTPLQHERQEQQPVDVHLLTACRQMLHAAAAAAAHQRVDGSGGEEGAASHPYTSNGAAGQGPANAPEAPAAASTTAVGGGSAAQAAAEAAAAALALVASDPRLSPLLVMTRDQAAVVAPVLRDALLDGRAWAPLSDTRSPQQEQQHEGQQEEQQGPAWPGGAPLRLRCSRRVRVAPGRGGLLELPGLVSATDTAKEWLLQHQQRLEEGGPQAGPADSAGPGEAEPAAQGSGAVVPQRGWLELPAGAPLRVLVVTREVLSLLLQQHPNPDVRRLLHTAGLEPRRRVLLAVLSALARARAAVARERGAGSFLSLQLAGGSALREPAAVEALLRGLAGGVAGYATADLAGLEALAERRGRAAGRSVAGTAHDGDVMGGGRQEGGGALPPWDVDYYMQAVAVEVASGAVWREFSDYFTLPGLWAGLDRLLATALGLRLLPPHGDGADQAWGPGVWHLQLWDADAAPPAGPSAGSQGQGLSAAGGGGGGMREGWSLLGDVFIEVAPPGGFPFTTLLRPTVAPHQGGASPRDEGGTSDGSGSYWPEPGPGAVVIRLPLALSIEGSSGGGDSSGDDDPDGPAPPGRPPALRGPFGLRALLHEAGHAVALLAASAAAPHPLVAAAAGAAGAGGGGGGVDARELPSHVFEAWAADPRALALLGQHWRTGAPLPPKAAVRLARYAFSASSCSALDLHEALLLALADARLHAASADDLGADAAAAGAAARLRSAPSDAQGALTGRGGGADAGSASEAERVFDEVWAMLGVLPGGGRCLEALRGLEALGPIGGAKWGYAAARLLAAAARKRWLGDDSLSRRGGRELKGRLLYGLGRGLPQQQLLAGLLGRDALARMEVHVQGDARGDAAAAGGDAAGGASTRVCWVPDLYSSAFQDVDLLG
ncbi:hypothetical protein MNEG_0577 [Monoraphidium neglectum]|uniref:Peptidase M3A/M3B catalytic domain-containing protein n=1 Tax=Monoraphidium neglectum TaxID=145388 RepID=A0A0D2MY11_9CHLO|nr:hypothetical protein MNEG_0577 [Monoraphidium neglectum]KIZ07370.1 hypothetical protein MNEG_0577 [Monoraphidium neglectum]|eukprot:XP_013906389.1 hypothetical protein MNEG_0577 [Monoraphidium neglectum]